MQVVCPRCGNVHDGVERTPGTHSAVCEQCVPVTDQEAQSVADFYSKPASHSSQRPRPPHPRQPKTPPAAPPPDQDR